MFRNSTILEDDEDTGVEEGRRRRRDGDRRRDVYVLLEGKNISNEGNRPYEKGV